MYTILMNTRNISKPNFAGTAAGINIKQTHHCALVKYSSADINVFIATNSCEPCLP